MNARAVALCLLFGVHIHSIAGERPASKCKDPHSISKFRQYAVSSEVAICSQVGARIMKNKGNAMDAAVATCICIGIVNPFSSGIGGGGFMLIHSKAAGQDAFDMLDFRETAPLKIDPAHFKKYPDDTKQGGMAVGTPGEIMGLYTAHKKYGRLAWARLFEENIIIARSFRAGKLLARKLESSRTAVMADEGLRRAFTRNGRLIKEGETVVRQNLATTLKTIAEDPMSFYTGSLAEKIVAAVRERGGVLSTKDLSSYAAKHRDVLTGTYRGYKVYTTSLPTAGVQILEALKILEAVNFDELRSMDENSGLYHFYQLIIETFKFITATRGELGDPDFIKRPDAILSRLLSTRHINGILAKINLDKALDASAYNKTCHFCEDHGTTHFNVIDQDGMIVQTTSTINLEFGAKFMDPVTGIVFNSQIDDFFIPGVRNAYKLAPAAGNLIEGGKRPFSSAAPVLLLKDGEVLAIGATGGTRIPTAIIGTLAYLTLGLSLDQAVAQCRIHNQLSPNVTYIEPTFPDEVRKVLERAGQMVQTSQLNTIFTSVQAIRVFRNSDGENTIVAVSDMRKMGQPDGL